MHLYVYRMYLAGDTTGELLLFAVQFWVLCVPCGLCDNIVAYIYIRVYYIPVLYEVQYYYLRTHMCRHAMNQSVCHPTTATMTRHRMGGVGDNDTPTGIIFLVVTVKITYSSTTWYRVPRHVMC